MRVRADSQRRENIAIKKPDYRSVVFRLRIFQSGDVFGGNRPATHYQWEANASAVLGGRVWSGHDEGKHFAQQPLQPRGSGGVELLERLVNFKGKTTHSFRLPPGAARCQTAEFCANAREEF